MSNIPTNIVREDVMEGAYGRPIGVSILSVLQVIGGALLLVTQLLSINQLNDASDELGISNVLLQTGIGFLGVIGIAAGIGMWLGKRWGWWLALFYFAYAVSRNVNVLLTISGMENQTGTVPQDLGAYYVKYAIRMLWNGVLLWYMCRETVTSYFRTADTNKWKALLIVFGICGVIFGIGSMF